MEAINGISFEDWGCACANLAAGMPESEVLTILGIELPVWQQTNDQWSAKLGDLMAEDMSLATQYGEFFTNPKQGKFANVATSTISKEDVLKQVPDLDTYHKIFWHQSKGAEVGADPVSILQEYDLTLQGWSTVGQHYMALEHELMRSENVSPEDQKKNYDFITQLSEKWQQRWEEHFKQDQANLADDIDF